MKKRKFSSLNWKLFIVFVLILSCSVLLVGITIYRYFLNYARESIDQSTQIIVDNHAKTVLALTEMEELLLKTCSKL